MNGAGHSHGDRHNHSGGISRGSGHSPGIRRGLAAAIGLNLVIVVAEVAAGLASGSLGLLSDAVHNFTDMAALGITWFAIEQAKKPATAEKDFRLSPHWYPHRTDQRADNGCGDPLDLLRSLAPLPQPSTGRWRPGHHYGNPCPLC